MLCPDFDKPKSFFKFSITFENWFSIISTSIFVLLNSQITHTKCIIAVQCRFFWLRNTNESRCFPLQVITFDDYGVSGHANHIAVHNAVNMSEDKTDVYSNSKTIPVFVLESVFIFRKYILFLDLANSIFAR